MSMLVRSVDCLSHDRAALRAAYLAAMVLIENGWHDWPAPAWDSPAILAFDGDKCVGGLNWTRDDKQRSVTIDFAWCNPTHPKALALCLLAFRKALRLHPALDVRFSCHPDNAAMMKLAQKLSLRPQSISFRVPMT